MKKILPLLLAVMLVIAMALPTLATEADTFDFNGHVLPLTEDMDPNLLVPGSGVYVWLFLMQGEDARYEMVVSGEPLFYDGERLVNNSDEQVYIATRLYMSAEWGESNEHLLDPGASYKPFTWFSSTKVWDNVTCDGSSCPVADFDLDEVCDTCGMALAYSVLRSYTPDGWPSEYPALPVGSDGNSHYILMTKDDGYTYLYIFTPYDASPVSEWNTVGSVHDSMQLKMYDASGNGVNVKRLTYRLGESGDWYQHDSQSVDSTLFGAFDEIDMIYSTLSFYKEDGTLFFPLPLWEEMEQVTQGEMMGLTTEVVGTMKVLVLCGVGCLALLVVLKLFGKRSLIYRN